MPGPSNSHAGQNSHAASAQATREEDKRQEEEEEGEEDDDDDDFHAMPDMENMYPVRRAAAQPRPQSETAPAKSKNKATASSKSVEAAVNGGGRSTAANGHHAAAKPSSAASKTDGAPAAAAPAAEHRHHKLHANGHRSSSASAAAPPRAPASQHHRRPDAEQATAAAVSLTRGSFGAKAQAPAAAAVAPGPRTRMAPPLPATLHLKSEAPVPAGHDECAACDGDHGAEPVAAKGVQPKTVTAAPPLASAKTAAAANGFSGVQHRSRHQPGTGDAQLPLPAKAATSHATSPGGAGKFHCLLRDMNWTLDIAADANSTVRWLRVGDTGPNCFSALLRLASWVVAFHFAARRCRGEQRRRAGRAADRPGRSAADHGQFGRENHRAGTSCVRGELEWWKRGHLAAAHGQRWGWRCAVAAHRHKQQPPRFFCKMKTRSKEGKRKLHGMAGLRPCLQGCGWMLRLSVVEGPGQWTKPKKFFISSCHHFRRKEKILFSQILPFLTPLPLFAVQAQREALRSKMRQQFAEFVAGASEQQT